MKFLSVLVLFLLALGANAQLVQTPLLPKLGLSPAAVTALVGELVPVKGSAALMTADTPLLESYKIGLCFNRGWFWDALAGYSVETNGAPLKLIEVHILLDREETLEKWKFNKEGTGYESEGGLVARLVDKDAKLWICQSASWMTTALIPAQTAVAVK